MTLIVIAFMVLISSVCGVAIWLIYNSCQSQLQHSNLLNQELLNRLFIGKGQPPTGVNLTEQYEEKKQAERERKESSGAKRIGPLDRVRKGWADRDRELKERGVDITSTKSN